MSIETTTTLSYDEQPKYFAVPDPDTGDMTYWIRNRRGQLRPWPTRPTQATYGPRLRRSEVPDGLSKGERSEFIENWFRLVRDPWEKHIHDAINGDPDVAHARFAAFRSRCFVCGRELTDDDSKVWGVGPVCRPGIPAEVLQETARMIGQIHGDREKQEAAQ